MARTSGNVRTALYGHAQKRGPDSRAAARRGAALPPNSAMGEGSAFDGEPCDPSPSLPLEFATLRVVTAFAVPGGQHPPNGEEGFPAPFPGRRGGGPVEGLPPSPTLPHPVAERPAGGLPPDPTRPPGGRSPPCPSLRRYGERGPGAAAFGAAVPVSGGQGTRPHKPP